MLEDFIRKNSYVKKVSAIILAGGYSMRMNAFKPLLALGDSTIIENTINVFRNSGVSDITVVIGYRANDLKIVLNQMGVNWIYNENYHQGMYSSVITGISSLPIDTQGFFLLPADMPLVKKETIRKLLKVNNSKVSDIIYPVYHGHRGHPPLISSNLLSPIMNWDGGGGLRALLSQYQNGTIHVEVEDENILTDIDTPDDYIKLCKTFRLRDATV